MMIDHIRLGNAIVLAPLAGITNLPFRLLAKEAGCGLVCSEMISANGLVYRSAKTVKMLASVPEEKPLSVQIFGSDPAIMAEAAKMVEDSGADILDINFGCSVRKILKTGSGSALMKMPELAASILEAVKKAIHIPLTIKIRSGWVKDGSQALEVARIAESSGVAAIAVHPRTATQGFRGRADWALIGEIKKTVSIPVIGNGDVVTAEDAVSMAAQTGCDGIMVGRAAIGNPWIFSQINDAFQGKPISPATLSQRRDLMIRYVRDSVRFIGEHYACPMMRSRLAWFVKGLYGASAFRESIKKVSTEREALEKINSYFDRLM